MASLNNSPEWKDQKKSSVVKNPKKPKSGLPKSMPPEFIGQLPIEHNIRTSPPSKQSTLKPFSQPKVSPPNQPTVTLPNQPKRSPPNQLKGSPPNQTRRSAPNQPKGSPPNQPRRSAPNQLKGSPPNQLKGSPPNQLKGSPPNQLKGSPPNQLKGSPPNQLKGSPPNQLKATPPKQSLVNSTIRQDGQSKSVPNSRIKVSAPARTKSVPVNPVRSNIDNDNDSGNNDVNDNGNVNGDDQIYSRAPQRVLDRTHSKTYRFGQNSLIIREQHNFPRTTSIGPQNSSLLSLSLFPIIEDDIDLDLDDTNLNDDFKLIEQQKIVNSKIIELQIELDKLMSVTAADPNSYFTTNPGHVLGL